MLHKEIKKRKSEEDEKNNHTGETETGSEFFKPCTARLSD
jgi:hypothetical protein